MVIRKKNITTSQHGLWMHSRFLNIHGLLHYLLQVSSETLNVIHEHYLLNGNLWFRGNLKFKNKKLTGHIDFFYENGQLETKRVYKNGLLNGPYERYYENGQLETKRVYKNGLLNGPYERYYENGQLETKRVYKNGLLIEELESFYKNGKVRYSGNDLNFSDNHDPVYCWDCGWCDLRLDHEIDLQPAEYYKDEKLVPNPGKIFSYRYPHEEKNITGVHECFHDPYYHNKRVKRRFSFINGKKHGFDEEYTYGGKLSEKTLWINEVCIHSTLRSFSDSGVVTDSSYEFFFLTEEEKNERYKPQEIKLNKVSITNSYLYEKGITSEFIFYTKDNSYLYQSTYFRSGNLRSQLEISKGKIHYYEFYASGKSKLELFLDPNKKDSDHVSLKTKLLNWNKENTPKDWVHEFL